jgi:hypothetical protein
MDGQRGTSILGATAVASIAVLTSFLTSTVIASRAYVQRGAEAERRARALEVTGSARTRIRSDLALWSIRVAGEAKGLEEAFARLTASVEAVRGFLKGRGFSDEAVTLGSIETTPHFGRDEKGNATREVVTYELARHVEIRVEERVEDVARAAGEVTELLKTGAHVESGAPRFVFTKLADLKLRMIGEATANGRERAERIAVESKCRLGAVKEARAGVLQITRPDSMEVSDSGMNDTTSIAKDVSAVVHLTFLIDPGT